MKTLSTLLGVALLAKSSLQHAAMMPASPDKVLTPNSVTAPNGCKLLACDKGFPSNETVKSELPQATFKQWGTLGPDWTVRATSVKDVQDAVNFARNHNVRLTIITSGHDFQGRNSGRSGLRLDMAGIAEPIQFATSWKCGDNLTPPATTACAVKRDTIVPATGATIPPTRRQKFKFFKKRDGDSIENDCSSRLKKRHTPGDDDAPAYNTIKPVAGQQAVARVPAGTDHETFYDAADASGLFAVGAQHGGVSVVGGWMQGGGHSAFAREYGMQVDNIVEIEVVTADGKFQKVSACNNPDLFWALRGGGGSTFGVVTAATVKVYPTFPIAVGRFILNSTSPKIWDSFAYFLQNGPDLRDNYGMQGYFYQMPAAFQSVLHMPGKYATLENAKAAFEPLAGNMSEIAGVPKPTVHYYHYDTYKQWYDAEQGTDNDEDNHLKWLSFYDASDGSSPSQAQAMADPMLVIPYAIKFPQTPTKRDLGYMRHAAVMKRDDDDMPTQPMQRTYLDSRLISATDIKQPTQAELGKLMNSTFPDIPGIALRGFLYGGEQQAAPAPDAMGLNPHWRTSTYHLIMNAVPGDARGDYDIAAWRKQWPDAGAYVNEASPATPDWKTAYWGTNYPKLETLKKQFDPKNVFWCSPCVGADMFTYDDERICPNAAYPQSGPAPQTLPNMKSKTGIASLPGVPGIANPLLPYIVAYLKNGSLPQTMPSFPGLPGSDSDASPSTSNNGGSDTSDGMSGMGGMGGSGSSSVAPPASSSPSMPGMSGMGGTGSSPAKPPTPSSSSMAGMTNTPPMSPSMTEGKGMAAIMAMLENMFNDWKKGKSGSGASQSPPE